MKTTIKTLLIAICTAVIAAGCCCNNSNKMEKYQKKYTNADYYVDGVFQAQVALDAMLDMFDFYGIPYTDYLKENMFISDFNLGDFENVGMGGVFFVNDKENCYFGHDIYLLPGQMIVEHCHVPTSAPAKHEAWIVRNGNCVSFGEGPATEGNPAIPASQKDFVTVSHHCVPVNEGEWTALSRTTSRHFLMAGSEGAIISEVGTYHDGEGLRFTNPNVVFTDVLSELRNK